MEFNHHDAHEGASIHVDDISVNQTVALGSPRSPMNTVTPMDYATAGEDDEEEDSGPMFCVGDIVDVMRRMWAGINRPGGVGRIKEINYDEEEDEYRYSVEYVVNGGRENNIERIYLNKAPDIEDNSKRQRHTRGRCR